MIFGSLTRFMSIVLCFHFYCFRFFIFTSTHTFLFHNFMPYLRCEYQLVSRAACLFSASFHWFRPTLPPLETSHQHSTPRPNVASSLYPTPTFQRTTMSGCKTDPTSPDTTTTSRTRAANMPKPRRSTLCPCSGVRPPVSTTPLSSTTSPPRLPTAATSRTSWASTSQTANPKRAAARCHQMMLPSTG